MACSVDVGTAFIVSARMEDKGEVKTKTIRDAFLEMEYNDDTKSILEDMGASFIQDGDRLYVTGDNSVSLANAIPGGKLRRPMKNGIISPEDRDAVKLLEVLLRDVLGEPKEKGELCFYSVPAHPINLKSGAFFSTDYHEDKLNQILEGIGYQPQSINEASCLAYSHLQDHRLTGLSTSWGAGMINVSHTVLGMPASNFSVIGSGDYVDQHVAFQFNTTPSKVIRLKENKDNPINIIKDRKNTDKQIEAICFAYKRLVTNLLKNLRIQLPKENFTEPVPLVLAGGTSLIKGFHDLVKETLKEVPLEFVSETIHVGEDAFYSVAKGALLRALVEAKKQPNNDKT